MNYELTAAILAGGRSSRFGTDKALFPWHGKPLVAHGVGALSPEVAEVLVVVKEGGSFDFLRELGARLVLDGRSDTNPYWGLLAALGALQTPWLFLCPCDVPFIQPSLLGALFDARGGARAVVPIWGGAEQPLAAIYHRDCIEFARTFAATHSNPSPRMLLQSLDPRVLSEEAVRIADPEGLSFWDADRVGDLVDLDPFAGGPRAL